MWIRKTSPFIIAALVAFTIGQRLIDNPATSQSFNNPITPVPTNTDNNSQGTILTSSDNQSQITLPSGWSENNTLNDSADIQAANVTEELYIIVISDSKSEVPNLDLQQHSDYTRQFIVDALDNAQVNQTGLTSVNSQPAIQYRIEGVYREQNIPVTYLHTTVETNGNYHQILTWTLADRFNANQSELQQVVESFREVSPSALR